MRRRLTSLGLVLLLAVPANPATAKAKTFDAEDFVVYGFSQSDVRPGGPAGLQAATPTSTIRAIGKWSTNGDEAADYNFAQIARYHAQGITFMGSGTASVIFPHDFATAEIFDDMSTRDADGNPVPHDEFGFPMPARRGNIFNPAYRAYLLGWAKIQIDGGVDGINLDEVNAGFSGGQKYGFNGNEGFDDYAIADFTRYLLAKYPRYTAADWTSRFGMTDDNLPRTRRARRRPGPQLQLPRRTCRPTAGTSTRSTPPTRWRPSGDG